MKAAGETLTDPRTPLSSLEQERSTVRANEFAIETGSNFASVEALEGEKVLGTLCRHLTVPRFALKQCRNRLYGEFGRSDTFLVSDAG